MTGEIKGYEFRIITLVKLKHQSKQRKMGVLTSHHNRKIIIRIVIKQLTLHTD